MIKRMKMLHFCGTFVNGATAVISQLRPAPQLLSSWGWEKYISQTKGGHAASFEAQENTDGLV